MSGVYDPKKADVWSCGVMLYVMLYSAYPFGSTSLGGGQLQFPSKPRVFGEAQNLIKQILVGSEARINMTDMFHHPWVSKVCLSRPHIRLSRKGCQSLAILIRV